MLICILTKNVITSCSVTMMLFLHLEVKPLMTLTTVLYLSCALISGHLAMMLMELTNRNRRLLIRGRNVNLFMQTAERAARLGRDQANVRTLLLMRQRPGGLLRQSSLSRQAAHPFGTFGDLHSGQRYWTLLGRRRIR